MKYKNKQFYIENVNAKKISNKFGTPTYCYSEARIKENIFKFKKNFKQINPLICFSVKSNNNLQILKIIKNNNLGADVVSKGELMISLKAGISPDKIVYSGVGKTYEDIMYAVNKKILLINAESENELKLIELIAKKKNKIVDVGIRLNPNIDALTNSKISTGRNIDKFGVDKNSLIKILKNYKKSKSINIKCLSVHIGSQITNYKPYIKMIKQIDKILKLVNHNFEFIDFGGGMGINYKKSDQKLSYSKLSESVKKFIKNRNIKIIFEPGRSIVGNSAILLTKIIYIKNSKNRNFIIFDAAMNDLMRPALYGSYHNIIPLKKNKKKIKKIHCFVGPVCETTDQFLTTKNYYKIDEGDILGICDVGAYGMVLSSNYNLRTKPPEIMINKSNFRSISSRQNLKDII